MELEWLNSQIVDGLSELVLVFDEKGDILFGNQTVVEKLEYKRDELTECNMTRIFRQDFPKAGEHAPAFDRSRIEGRGELTMYRKNSSCFPVNARVLPTAQAGVCVLLAEDVTVLRDMKLRMRELKEEGQENLRRRNEFTANVTHELRTPVNGIKGHVSTLLNEVQDAQQRRTLDIVLYCCENMLAIINNILDFSKLETGKFTIEEKEFDFYQMMDRVIATHSAEIHKKELRLSVDVDKKIPQFLIGDELRLVQVLNNLLSNAVKFTMAGSVSVVAGKTMQAGDEVELFFMVKDSGIGISPQEQDKLFQSFSQVDASITRRFGGTGLGLAITKQLVELMHGDIHLESEKGKGSTFSFSVKLRTNQQADEKQNEVYVDWSEYTNKENTEEETGLLQFGEQENRAELKKRMDKLVLSIEMGAWDKAEMLASTVKALVEKSDDDIKKQVLRMEMAIRKCNYDKSMAMYENLKAAISEQIGEL